MPVMGTFPVLVSVKAWQGPPPNQRNPAPTPRFAVGVHFVGVRVAVVTAAIPVPDRATGEPLTATPAEMVRLPDFKPVEVGLNTIPIVQLVLPARVKPALAPQVPLFPVARAYDPENERLIPVADDPPVLLSVTV